MIIDVPAERADTSTAFWSAVLGWPAGTAWPGQPEFCSFEPPTGTAYVHRQVGDHGPRVHVDLEVDDVAAETARLRDVGARIDHRLPDGQVMLSPGGLLFCLIGRQTHDVPDPVAWPGHRSRLVQVCIDSPPDRHDREVAFWQEATNGRWVRGGREFTGKLYPQDGPVQLLIQRLGDDIAGQPTTAHIDLGTDDIDAELTRVVALGATALWPGDGWHAVRDPSGMIFCVTANPPR